MALLDGRTLDERENAGSRYDNGIPLDERMMGGRVMDLATMALLDGRETAE